MDVRANRVRLLLRTMERCGVTNVAVVHGRADEPLPFRSEEFALLLVDARVLVSARFVVIRTSDGGARRTISLVSPQHSAPCFCAPLIS